MKIKNLFLLVLVLFSFSVFAQSNLLNAKIPNEIGKKSAAQLNSDNDKPLPYGYVHDKDVLYGKTVCEFIDLDERVNFPLYYPTDSVNVGKERRCLFNVLLKGIKDGKITEVYADEYFNTKKSIKDMSSSFKYIDTLDAGKEIINNDRDSYFGKTVPERTVVTRARKATKKSPAVPASTQVIPAQTIAALKTLDRQYVDERELKPDDIAGYRVKGYWYFDKRQSEMKYRMLAICPVSPEARDSGKDKADVIDLFWIYFPAMRDVLHESYAFNDRNSSMPISFDHLLNARRFSGVIYKVDNVYGDRTVEDYMKDNAQMQLLESERIKETIRNFEQDMWNY